MVESWSTTVVIVGDDGGLLHSLDRMANVRAASLAGRDDEDVTRWSRSATTPYVVHDRDPLEHVAAAWVEFFDDRSTLGALELEVDRAVDALSSGSVAIPDYYVVVESESLPPTWRHWWLGVMAQASPTRVIPRRESDPPLARLLRRLPTGRAWPEPRWLRSLSGAVPDRVGLGSAA